MRRLNVAAERRLCERWASVPIGTRVRVTRDDGSVTQTATRSEPWLLGHGQAVIKVDGIAGGYLLSRVALAERLVPK